METLGNNLVAKSGKKVANNYYCEKCDYKCSKIYNWKKHIGTSKHQQETLGNILETPSGKKEHNESHNCCEKCNKEFKTRSGLWKHKKDCYIEDVEHNKMENILVDKNDDKNIDKDLILMLIKQNTELLEVIKNGTHNTDSHNTTTNSYNKAFNLQFFLNETCKDAMNIMDFVDSIQLQLSDLERVGEKGYIDGISNIIIQNLKGLDVSQRPVHCTDKKRETIYVKDENIWEKDEEKLKMHKLVRKVQDKNFKMIQKFREKYPDYNKASSRHSDTYNNIIIESMGGRGDNDFEKEEKIIHKVSKEVVVEK
jgi:Txe/YoeB family toxin of Txe-Axe toxin-antitoxin module